jgi:hypothetical protein
LLSGDIADPGMAAVDRTKPNLLRFRSTVKVRADSRRSDVKSPSIPVRLTSDPGPRMAAKEAQARERASEGNRRRKKQSFERKSL